MATATSRKALVMHHLRTALSNSTEFQTWVGAATPAEALDRIHVDDLPRSIEGKRTRSEWEALRPYVVLRDETYAMDNESEPESVWPITGALSLVFHDNALYTDTWWDRYVKFINPVGAIVDQLAAESETPGHLVFQRLAFEEGIQHAFDSELEDLGDFVFIEAVVEYRAGA